MPQKKTSQCGLVIGSEELCACGSWKRKSINIRAVPTVLSWYHVQQSLAACNHLTGGLGPHFNHFQEDKLTEVHATMIWKSHFFSVWIMLMNKTTWGTRPGTRIPETEADRASRRNAGTAEAVVIDRWQMVSLFETQRTSTEPAAKICNARKRAHYDLTLWLAQQWTFRVWVLLYLKHQRRLQLRAGKLEGKRKKKKHHTRVYFPLSFSCSYFNSLISTVIALPRPQQSSAESKKIKKRAALPFSPLQKV